MAAYTIDDLVSQAEAGGCTLAEVMSSRLSADDLAGLQSELGRMIAENYRSIESFMSDVEVPSIADLSVLPAGVLDELEDEIRVALSDEPALAH